MNRPLVVQSGVWGMGRPSQRAIKRVLACSAVVGVGVVAGLLAGFGADSAETSGLSPAQIVALRFPADVSLAVDDPVDAAATEPQSPASGYVLASADAQQISNLIFSPVPAYPTATANPPPARTVAARPVHVTPPPSETSLPPQFATVDAEPPPAVLAYAAPDAPEAAPAARPAPPVPAPAPVKHAAPPPKPASASNAVLNSAQIASIRERLKLSSYQSTLWPPVESALRDISYQPGHDGGRKTAMNPRGGTVDPTSAPVQRLKSAAFPLLMSLSEDQKEEVRSMVRLMGLENLASQF